MRKNGQVVLEKVYNEYKLYFGRTIPFEYGNKIVIINENNV